MNPWDENFPVGMLKSHLLKPYVRKIGYSSINYDVEMMREFRTVKGISELSKNVKYLSIPEAVRLKKDFLDTGLPVCLTVGYPSHAVAYILQGETLYVFDTQKSETTDIYPELAKEVISSLFQKEFQFVDVLQTRPKLEIQTEDDNLCVIWMLFIVESVGYMQIKYNKFDLDMILSLIEISSKKAGDSLAFINQVLAKYQRGVSAFSSGGRSKMSCGDMKGGFIEDEDLPEGGRRPKKWIQDVVKGMEKGSFSKQSKRHHESPMEYAKDVLKHPKKHTLKTRRRAQFLVNIAKRKGTRKVSRRK